MASVVNLDTDSQLEEIAKAPLSVLNFWAAWAKPCEQIRSVLDELAKDSSISAGTSFVHIEAERFPEISQKYEVIAVPTCVLLKNGKVAERINGVYPAEITQKIRSLSSVALPVVDLQTRLRQLVHSSPVMLFMKGSPDSVRCGFSRKMVELLGRLNVTYKSFDILSDETVRQGLKDFSKWPSYPQLYVNGELLGGLDIVSEMADNGELQQAIPADCVRRPLEQRLAELVRRDRVMVFMKGSPEEPRCGFSRKIVAILQESEAPFGHFDILGDEEVRQGLKEFSKWPTYPQVYVNGELVGGLDIVKELAESGDLKSTLTAT